MDGAVVGEEKPPSAFDGVSLTVDGYVLDARKLKTIEQDGTLVYEEPKPPQANETETLQRIWDEVPGGFLDLSEAKLRQSDPNEEYEMKEEEAVAEEGEKGGLMSAEEMEALRTTVCANLNDARNELWFVFELAKTLAASANMTAHPPPEPIPSAPLSKKEREKDKKKTLAQSAMTSVASTPLPSGPETELVLPAGTYTTTPGLASELPLNVQAEKLEVALQARARALDECGDLIDAAVSELELMSKASERFSADLSSLRGSELWAIVPKPDFGRSIQPGGRARDVVIPYALDEAPSALHSRSLAAFDLDPERPEMVFGARSFLRLRFLLRRGNDAPTYSSSIYDANVEEGANDLCAVMRAAQVETLDEDLFSELRSEAARVEGALVEPRSFTLKVGIYKLTVELYDTRSPPSKPASHLADMLLGVARLNMLYSYKRRKARIVSGTGQQVPGALVTLLSLIQFNGALSSIRPMLEQIHQTLLKAGLSAHLAERHSCGDPKVSVALMTARAKHDVLGVVFSLDVAGSSNTDADGPSIFVGGGIGVGPGPSTGGSGGRGFLSVNLTAPAGVTVVIPGTSFPVKDLDALPGTVAETIAGQLSPLLYRGVKGQSGVFYDELERCIVLGDRGLVSISIPAPHTSLIASVDGEVYDSATSDQSLEQWLLALAKECSS